MLSLESVVEDLTFALALRRESAYRAKLRQGAYATLAKAILSDEHGAIALFTETTGAKARWVREAA
jgi:hypothetical protein